MGPRMREDMEVGVRGIATARDSSARLRCAGNDICGEEDGLPTTREQRREGAHQGRPYGGRENAEEVVLGLGVEDVLGEDSAA